MIKLFFFFSFRGVNYCLELFSLSQYIRSRLLIFLSHYYYFSHFHCSVSVSVQDLHLSSCCSVLIELLDCIIVLATLGPANNDRKDAKETGHYKWVFVVTKLFNIKVNDFDAKKSARHSQVVVVTEFVTSETQCTLSQLWVAFSSFN